MEYNTTITSLELIGSNTKIFENSIKENLKVSILHNEDSELDAVLDKLGREKTDVYKNALINEINHQSTLEIKKHLYEKASADFICLSGDEGDLVDGKGYNKIIYDYLEKNNYDFIISNGLICGWLCDYSTLYFNNNNVTSSNKHSQVGQSLYLVGKIANIDIIVDPYMKYSEYRILCGKKENLLKYALNYEIYNDVLDKAMVLNAELEYELSIDKCKLLSLQLT